MKIYLLMLAMLTGIQASAFVSGNPPQGPILTSQIPNDEAGCTRVSGGDITCSSGKVSITDGSGIANYTVNGSSEPNEGIGSGGSLASTTYVGLATTTVVMRGGRPAFIQSVMQANNGSGGARTYQCILTENSVQIDGPHQQSNQAGGSESIVFFKRQASSTAGTRSFALLCKSNNATGTQTADDVHLNVFEF